MDLSACLRWVTNISSHYCPKKRAVQKEQPQKNVHEPAPLARITSEALDNEPLLRILPFFRRFCSYTRPPCTCTKIIGVKNTKPWPWSVVCGPGEWIRAAIFLHVSFYFYHDKPPWNSLKIVLLFSIRPLWKIIYRREELTCFVFSATWNELFWWKPWRIRWYRLVSSNTLPYKTHNLTLNQHSAE